MMNYWIEFLIYFLGGFLVVWLYYFIKSKMETYASLNKMNKYAKLISGYIFFGLTLLIMVYIFVIFIVNVNFSTIESIFSDLLLLVFGFLIPLVIYAKNLFAKNKNHVPFIERVEVYFSYFLIFSAVAGYNSFIYENSMYLFYLITMLVGLVYYLSKFIDYCLHLPRE